MTSLDVIEFELTIKRFVQDYDLPTEVKRMVLKNIYDETTQLAQEEVLQQIKDREEKEKKKYRTIYHEDSQNSK